LKSQLSGTILYIEDEEDYQILVKRILRKTGLTVSTADTGAEGLAMLAEIRPDLLILDINLPDTDGYAICAQLRQDPAWADLPILMLTVRRRPEEWLRGFSSGANDYISKPLNPPELMERVISCLEGKSPSANTAEKAAEYQLVQAAVSGNQKAFEVLVEQFRPRLMDNLHALGHSTPTAEDLASMTLTTAYQKANQFRGESNFYTWLYRIALSLSRDHGLRRTHDSLDAIAEGDESLLSADFTDQDSVHDDLSRKELSMRAQDALRLVPPDYRELLEKFFIEDLTYDEIARRMRIPIGTVMSRMHRARQLLQDAWKKREALPLRLV